VRHLTTPTCCCACTGSWGQGLQLAVASSQ
jgi:hypothetical protein